MSLNLGDHLSVEVDIVGHFSAVGVILGKHVSGRIVMVDDGLSCGGFFDPQTIPVVAGFRHQGAAGSEGPDLVEPVVSQGETFAAPGARGQVSGGIVGIGAGLVARGAGQAVGGVVVGGVDPVDGFGQAITGDIVGECAISPVAIEGGDAVQLVVTKNLVFACIQLIQDGDGIAQRIVAVGIVHHRAGAHFCREKTGIVGEAAVQPVAAGVTKGLSGEIVGSRGDESGDAGDFVVA